MPPIADTEMIAGLELRFEIVMRSNISEEALHHAYLNRAACIKMY
jgi:hypothetical protein